MFMGLEWLAVFRAIRVAGPPPPMRTGEVLPDREMHLVGEWGDEYGERARDDRRPARRFAVRSAHTVMMTEHSHGPGVLDELTPIARDLRQQIPDVPRAFAAFREFVAVVAAAPSTPSTPSTPSSTPG